MGLFLVAVLFLAARAGIGWGVLATAFSLGVMFFLFKESVSIVLEQYSRLALFGVTGVAVSFVAGRLYIANVQLKEARAEVDAINKKLLDHAESLADANARLAGQARMQSQMDEQIHEAVARLWNDIQAPLRSIAVSADVLSRCDAKNLDVTIKQHTELIADEIRRIDEMMTGLRIYSNGRRSP